MNHQKISFYLKSAYYLIIFFIVFACKKNEYQPKNDIQNKTEHPKFVGKETCIECHKSEYDSWNGSHHDQAMKIADSTTVLANFNNKIFKHKGVKHTFFKRGNDYYVNTADKNGNYQDYKIVYTFGVTPLQQYIVKFPDGAYQCLITAWDTEKNKWFHLQPNLELAHDEWINWTGGAMRWNTACADCHSTNLDKNFDSNTNTFNTSYSEINVSCEACHGPASNHVSFYKNGNTDALPQKLYMGKSLTSKSLVQKCARCHSRRSQITKKFDYKGHFLDHYSPSLLIDPIYELDGQIKDEDYVYGSFMQSKMYQNDVTCVDCHDAHSLKLKQSGNNLCLSCHEPKYNSKSHHYHPLNTEGAQCINCHMTGKTYMGNDFRRDHSFRVPRPDQSVKYGTPNACNGCHKDKSAEWASKFIDAKYGTKRPDHFSNYLLEGYNDNHEAFYTLISQNKFPEIARATALYQYTNNLLSRKEINDVRKFLKDSSILVRHEAVRAFEKIQDQSYHKDIEPLLKDSTRLVRIAAVKYFNSIGANMEGNSDFNKAEKEYLESLDMSADFASGQHQIAVYNEMKGYTDLAIEAYKRALEIDNRYNVSRMNLALLLYKKGNIEEAKNLYLKVIELEPDYSNSYYMLGLLFNEIGDTKNALKYLAEACDKKPVNIRAFYNYALKLQAENLNQKSIEIINKALVVFPENENLLYVKLLGEINLKHHVEAYNTCSKLIQIAPNNATYKQVFEKLKSS
ncbi:multiheme c-type cytochrome [Flavivirga rizhaonensis]|uniref:Tetratricopeptide repeat protein n=1 Tax=Flavivirga rizhaonensis TaxID=2559571 RepID=A0A4S1E3F8_9FLAO|nr:multiheme c-type cytochrome [Flavivirga rizhaonensis]TGV04558.1 tetratricopeptide repeat protein [Flavivirga rizhaonensis]